MTIFNEHFYDHPLPARDLVCSFEVGEHLPAASATQLLQTAAAAR
jgi:hypothetical protein